jgi:uncharacterized tellurite resistance protein B-like protein
MERKEFIEILLEIAFASMVCDGDIASEEQAFLKDIEKSDFYLKEFDLSKRLDELILLWELHGLSVCEKILNKTYKLTLTEDQKIVVLDFAIGIVRSDGTMQQAEIEFINSLMLNIKIPMDIVNMRYGNWSVITSIDLGGQQENSESQY